MAIESKEFLERFPVLGEELRGADIAPLLSAMTLRPLATGEVLIHEGKASDRAYFLRDGELVISLGIGGAQAELGRAVAGVIVGEVAFLDGKPATASVTSAAPGHAYELTRDVFTRLQAAHPRLAAAVLRDLCRTLAARLRRASDHYEELGMARDGAGRTRPERRGLLDAMRRMFGL